MLWSKDGLDHTVNIPLPSYWVYGIYDTYGYLGTYCPVGYPNCPSQITVGKMPVYLELAAKSPRVALPFIRNYYTLYAQGEDWNFENGFGTNWTPVTTGGQPVSLVTAAQIDPTTGQIDMNIPLFGEYTSAILGDPNYACNGVPVFPRHLQPPTLSPSSSAALETTFDVPLVNAVTPIFLNFQYIIYTQDWWNSVTNPTPYPYDNFEVYINNTRKFRDGNKETNDLGCKWYRIPSTNNPRTADLPRLGKGTD